MVLRTKRKKSKATQVRGLFVGVETFENGDVGSASCRDDATSLYMVFHEKNQDVVRLCDEAATGKKVLGSLSELMSRVCPGELLVLFVSTVGKSEHNDFFLMPYDGDLGNSLGTGISSKMLINAMGLVADQGVNVLLILDASHSATIGFDISKSQSKNGGGISCLFSTSPVEERCDSEPPGQDHFSQHLVDGLRGKADVDGNGVITLRNLYDYVYQRTQVHSNKMQHPILIGTVPNETPLLVTG